MLTFLDRHGEDLASLYENAEWPTELMRDPTYWLEADKMEGFLDFLTTRFGHAVADGALPAEVGRHAVELRAWGALDSVLRLVQSPKDLFSQPERLLSYFISPAPPVGNVRREADAILFELPLDASEYPLVTQYLRAALESLPTYVGRPAATVRWQDSEIAIRWTESQESLFHEREALEGRNVNPDLVRNVLQSLEESQRSLEEAQTRLALKNKELDSLRVQLRQAQSRPKAPGPAMAQERLALRETENAALAPALGTAEASADGVAADGNSMPFLPPAAARELAGRWKGGLSTSLTGALDQAYRLGDYVGRAQQIVTILVGQGRATPQVQEAMRRVDWETVQANAPLAARAVANALQAMREQLAPPPTEPQGEAAPDEGSASASGDALPGSAILPPSDNNLRHQPEEVLRKEGGMHA